MVVKVDLSKLYEIVSYLCLYLMLIYMGFNVPFVTWVLNYGTFDVLNNVFALDFCMPKRRIWWRCHLSSFFILLVVKALTMSLLEAKRVGFFKGIRIQWRNCNWNKSSLRKIYECDIDSHNKTYTLIVFTTMICIEHLR